MANSADGFDCPVCWEPLRRPVYQCVNGHLICSVCIGRIERTNKVCPTCRVALGDRIRCLEADRRADSRRPSPYSPAPPPAPRAPAPSGPPAVLPESAQRAARRFSTDACPKPRPAFNIFEGPRDNRDTLVEIYVSKMSDELVGFGDEPLVSGGATFQVQLKSNTPSVLADFAESLDVFLQARPTSPQSVSELRGAGIKLVAGNVRPILYVAAVEAAIVENTVRLLQEFLRSKCRHARFPTRTEVRDERVFHAPPPFGSRWIKLRIDTKDSLVSLFFDGDHYIYRERLDAHDVAGIYSDRRFCRGLEVEASESSERDRALRVIREVFRGLVMRVCLVEQHTSPYAAAFIAELRRMQCLRFR